MSLAGCAAFALGLPVWNLGPLGNVLPLEEQVSDRSAAKSRLFAKAKRTPKSKPNKKEDKVVMKTKKSARKDKIFPI